MQKIRKVDVLSVAKFQAFFGAIIGLLLGLLYAALGASLDAIIGSVGLGSGLGLIAIIAFPIFYGIVGFVGGTIFALLYNLVAKMTGGIKIELAGVFDQTPEDTEKKDTPSLEPKQDSTESIYPTGEDTKEDPSIVKNFE